MSYYEFLGLKVEPFSTSPDPAFFYESGTRKQVLNNLMGELNLQRGLSVVLGDIGTVLESLLRILGIEMPSLAQLSDTKIEEAIKDFLFQTKLKENKIVVLIIDEAQKLLPDSLEVLRILLNYETDKGKLLQIILFGQFELHHKLARMPNLMDRVSFKVVLTPLDRAETFQLIRFRLQQAGHKTGKDIFTTDAIKKIYSTSRGSPRQVALLFHRALRNIVQQNKGTADYTIIKQILTEAKKERRLAGKADPVLAQLGGGTKITAIRKWAYSGIILGLVLISGALTWLVFNQKKVNLPPPDRIRAGVQPDHTAELTKIESLYQNMLEQLKAEQSKTAALMPELTKSKNNQPSVNAEPQQIARMGSPGGEELVKQINQLNESQENAQKRIMAAIEEIARSQSQATQENKELASRLGQLKDEFSAILDKKSAVPATEDVYTIRLIDAVITPADWTDNDLGSQGAPPDPLVIVYQNDKEIFRSRVKPDTRTPAWDEEFTLTWQKDDKLEMVIYDLDPPANEVSPAGLERILSWNNRKDKEFLFKGNRLLSPKGSYLNYQLSKK
ncbi:MAG: AAA family ATPase [Planctomycetes bacterium]|nr:AAA family ATPase [Planctomycetota bacterium]